MSEMLANHFFLIRDYEHAAIAYENVIDNIGVSYKIRKKIIICYIKTNKIQKAISEFLSLAKEDVRFLLNPNIKNDDCPCPEIISEIEREEISFNNVYEKYISLGILWLFCDIDQSIIYFEKALQANPNELTFYKILQTLKTKTEEK